MKYLAIFALILCVAAGSHAALNWSYGWEDGTGTALGTFGNVGTLENSTEQAQEGTRSLKIVEDPIGGTPQVFVWWVTGLQDGDTVTASFYCYDTTPGGSPSGRIWGHYTASSTDVNDYTGSAGGSDEYPAGTGWSALTNTWTFDSNSGANTGLVVEARIYSGAAPPDNVIYVDTTYISVSRESAVIHRADGATVPEPAFFGLLPLALFFFRRK